MIAYCQRFYYNLKHREARKGDVLTAKDLRTALHTCIRNVQQEFYSEELQDLSANGEVSNKSKLRDLHPFIDDQGLMRVGGRLANANLAYDNKHQFILPPQHHFTELVITSEHRKLLHAGTQLVMSSLRQQYWIPRCRQIVKNIIRKCVTCVKLKAQVTEQLMGQLPAARVNPGRLFLNTGTDFAGPIYVKPSRRSRAKSKTYIAIFVCLAVKAIHLELVTDLTSEAFIAALRRFIARRGKCLHIFSDNAKNFVGANHELRALSDLFKSEVFKKSLQDFVSTEGITWHFIPPNSPTFGGLWESSIKSMKFHLRRVVGPSVLTYEELYTLLTQIEACLNSRPLSVLSDDPGDPSALTPGHFLIGTPLTSLPEPSLQDVPQNHLSRWQRLQQMLQHIWHRWSLDYINGLQQRNKWKVQRENLKPGQVVLVKDNNLPPLSWKLGVIKNVFVGNDGLVRVVEVKTKSGMFKRAVNRLVVLPVNT